MLWWLDCVVLTALLWAIRVAVEHNATPELVDTAFDFTMYLGLVAVQVLVIPVWQTVGLWRGSERHMARSGTILAGRLTQLMATLFTLGLLAQALWPMEALVSGARVAYALGPYHFQVTVAPGAREIQVRGGLGFGVADRVAADLRRAPKVRRIELESGGGSLLEALKLRAIIRRHQLNTYTARECSSACVSAYIAGRHRYLRRGGRLGFHLPRPSGLFQTGPVPAGYRQEIEYFRLRGVPPWFINRWIASGRQMWYPSLLQLRRAGIVQTALGAPAEAAPGMTEAPAPAVGSGTAMGPAR